MNIFSDSLSESVAKLSKSLKETTTVYEIKNITADKILS